jgi:hypothetical protein
MLACYFAGCAVSAETTGGQLDQIKPGMTREEVIGSLGEPAETNLVNSAPSEDLYTCDEQGQVMVVRNPQSSLLTLPLALVPFVALVLIPVGIVDAVIDPTNPRNLSKRTRKCTVNYDQGKVVSTGQTGGIVYTK